MGKESIREALIEELWPLVKTNGLGARERTAQLLDELERQGLLKMWQWRCDRCGEIMIQGIGHGPGICVDRSPAPRVWDLDAEALRMIPDPEVDERTGH